jgi:hypothetical protein
MLQSIAESLGLSAEEYRALIAVRDGLRAGKLRLDMHNGDCCIAGHMQAHVGKRFFTTEVGRLDQTHLLRQLCYPPVLHKRWLWFDWQRENPGWQATPAQAADAIDRVLLGVNPWT